MAGKNDKIKDSERYSIVVKDLSRCYICGSSPTHIHEIFGGSNRAKSKEDGMCIGLCAFHHNGSKFGVHFNKELDDRIKQQAERIWIDKYTSKDLSMEERIQKFINRFGRNYLDE